MLVTARFTDAFDYACKVHGDQTRKAAPYPVPYVTHVMAVAARVMEAGGNEEVAIAAFLHDTAEDQGGMSRLSDIELLFGQRVANIVLECSDDVPELGMVKRPWRIRKDEHLAHMPELSPEALLIIAADKLHNCRSTLSAIRTQGDEAYKAFRAGKEGTIWYDQSVTAVLVDLVQIPGRIAGAGAEDLVNELVAAVADLR